MTRDEMLLLVPIDLWRLLSLMFRKMRQWREHIGYPPTSAGLASGGIVGIDSIEDMEEEADNYAATVTEAAYDELTPAEQIAIRVVMGVEPAVWSWRPGVLEAAVMKLETRLRRNGVC